MTDGRGGDIRNDLSTTRSAIWPHTSRGGNLIFRMDNSKVGCVDNGRGISLNFYPLIGLLSSTLSIFSLLFDRWMLIFTLTFKTIDTCFQKDYVKIRIKYYSVSAKVLLYSFSLSGLISLTS